MEQQFQNSQNQNKTKIKPQSINQYLMQYYDEPAQKKTKDKLENFKKRLEAFDKISTYSEAKALLEKTMPVQLERTTFFIGDAKCTIISNSNLIRIFFKAPEEILIYDFTK